MMPESCRENTLASALTSVVLPTLNSGENLRQLLDSVVLQDYRPIEVLVVDGGSADDTREIVENYMRTGPLDGLTFALYHERDFGSVRSSSNARRIGVQKSVGAYVAFLDSDMVFSDRSALSKLVAALQRNPYAGVHTKHAECTRIEAEIGKRDAKVHAYCAYRREVFQLAMHNAELGYGEDQDFAARIGQDIDTEEYVDATITRHYPHTWAECRRQALWYGRTELTFYRRTGRNPPSPIRSISFLGAVWPLLRTHEALMKALLPLAVLSYFVGVSLVTCLWLGRIAATSDRLHQLLRLHNLWWRSAGNVLGILGVNSPSRG